MRHQHDRSFFGKVNKLTLKLPLYGTLHTRRVLQVVFYRQVDVKPTGHEYRASFPHESALQENTS